MLTKGFKPGDRVWYRNEFGQSFYATVVRTLPEHGAIVTKREEWPNEEITDLDCYPVSRHFKMRNGVCVNR